MKKTSYRKEAMLLVTFVTTFLLITTWGYSQQPEDTKEVAKERSYEKPDNEKNEQDSLFLVNAAEASMEQIQLGRLAQQNGTSTHVKELGEKMEDAYNQSLNDLTALAERKMITIPTSVTDNESYRTLSEKSGDDFDKAYADLMVSKNEDAIEAFEKASTDSYDTEIKNWANTSLSELRKQQDLAVETQKKCTDM